MKKDKYLYIIVIVCVLLLISTILFYKISYEKNKKHEKYEEVGKFNFIEYEEQIRKMEPWEKFTPNIVTQRITSNEIAKKEAERVWIDLYGDEVKENKPYKVFYDKQEDTWLITGSLPPGWIGGVPYALIRTNGEIIAVWHDE